MPSKRFATKRKEKRTKQYEKQKESREEKHEEAAPDSTFTSKDLPEIISSATALETKKSERCRCACAPIGPLTLLARCCLQLSTYCIHVHVTKNSWVPRTWRKLM